MSKSFRRGAAVLVALACVVSTGRKARAQGVDAYGKALREVNELVNADLPTPARAKLAEAGKLFDALGEFEKPKVQDFKSFSSSFESSVAQHTAQLAYSLEQQLSSAEGYIESFKSNPEQDDHYANDSVTHVVKALADPENKKTLAADVVAKLQRKMDWLKVELPKARSAGWVARAQDAVRQVQQFVDDPRPTKDDEVGESDYNSAKYVSQGLKTAEDLLARALPDDPAVKDARAKAATLRQAYDAKVEAIHYSWLVKTSLRLWDRLKKQSGEECEGWEEETTPATLEVFLRGRREDESHKSAGGKRREGQGGTWDEAGTVGCYRSLRYLALVPQSWLGDEHVKAALAAYPNDPDLKRVETEATRIVATVGGKVVQFTNKILDLCEKLAAGKDRRDFESAATSLGYSLDRALDGCAGYVALHGRIKGLEQRFKGDEAKSDADRSALEKELARAADAAWPELTKSWVASAKKLDAPAAVHKIDDWKGTAVDLVPGGAWSGEFWFLGDCDGVPVCGNLDDGLPKPLSEACERVGIERYEVEEVIGVVNGTCVARERLRDTRGNWYDGSSRDGVRLRIVAVKTKLFAVALGKGSSVDQAKGVPAASSSSASGSGVLVWGHRFLAWAMCALLALAGGLALAHGASKFVPQVQEQKAKLGDSLGYAGAGLAVVGLVWFGAAIVLSVLGLCRFGSLPSVALILGGVASGLDLVRAKGKITPELASTLQPAGILFGLGCFAAAAVHFLCWDFMLL